MISISISIPIPARARPARPGGPCAAALFAALALAAGSANAQTLRDSLARAAALDPAIAALEARAAEVAASHAVAAARFPAAPTLTAGLRRSRPDQDIGRNEVDLQVGLPLWLPGQRGLREQLAEREGGERDAALDEARLALAGRLREAWWTIAEARADAQAAQRRTVTLERIEADTARRVAAGVLARADLLLAQAELSAARARAADAALRVAALLEQWFALTGERTPPADPAEREPLAAGSGRDERIASAADGTHPALVSLRSRVALARARFDLAAGVRRDPPELVLQHRSDRAVYGAEYRNTVLVALRVPFATEARNAPRVAAAGTELAATEAALAQRSRGIAAELAQSAAAVHAAFARHELAAERLRHAREHEALVVRAFALGEQPLVAALRAATLREDAEAEAERAALAVGAAQARRAQAAGVLP